MKHKIHMLRQAIQEVSARTITLHIHVTINGTFILKKNMRYQLVPLRL